MSAALPKASVIMPAYNRADTIQRAVRSAQAQTTFDDLFWLLRPEDSELRAIRSLMLLDIARVALRTGQRARALQALRQAREGLPRFWRAISLYCIASCLPSPLALRLWATLDRGVEVFRQLGRGEISASVLLRKARNKVGWT